jgi:hypothetical protein
MAKTTPVQYNVQFNKLQGEVALELKATLIEIDLEGKDARPFFHIERKGNRWLLMHGGGALGSTFPNAIDLEIIRMADDRWLRNMATKKDYPIKGLTKLNVKPPLFHFDAIGEPSEDSWRMTFSDGMFDTTAVLTSISFSRCAG